MHGQQRRPVDRDQRRGERQRGLALQPDPGRGHRSGHRHGHQLRSSTGATATPTATARDGVKTHTYADGPNDYDVTVDLVDEDGTFLDRANDALGARQQRRSDGHPHRCRARSTRARPTAYSYTVTDPGTTTVFARDAPAATAARSPARPSARQPAPAASTARYADGPNDAQRRRSTGSDGDGDARTPTTRRRCTVDNVAPIDRHQRCKPASNEGSTVQPDTRRGHRSGHRHGHDATIVHWGDGNRPTPTATDGASRRTPTPTARTTTTVTRRSGRRRTARSSTATRSRCTVNNVAPTIALSGRRRVNEGSTHSLQLHGHRSGHRHVHGRRRLPDLRHQRHARRHADQTTAAAAASQCNFADGPATTDVTIKVDRRRRRLRHGLRDASSIVTVANVDPVVTAAANQSSDEGDVAHLHPRLVHRSGRGQPVGRLGRLGRRLDRHDLHGRLGRHARHQSHTYADGPNDHTVTVDRHRRGRRLPDSRHALGARRQRRSDDRDQRRAAASTRARPTRLTLGAVTDPGTDTVTSYIVHWGDGNTDTLQLATASKTHTYADGAERPRRHRRPGRRGRHLPRPRERALGARSTNVAPTVAPQRLRAGQRGLDLHATATRRTDPGADTFSRTHRAARRHALRRHLHRSTARQLRPHLRRRPEPHYDRRGRPSPTATATLRRATRSRSRSTTSLRRSTLTGASPVNEGSTHTYSFTTTDPGSRHLQLGRDRVRHGGTLGRVRHVQRRHGAAASSARSRMARPARPQRDRLATRTARSDSDTVAVTVINVKPSIVADGRRRGRGGLDAHLQLHGHRSGRRHAHDRRPPAA